LRDAVLDLDAAVGTVEDSVVVRAAVAGEREPFRSIVIPAAPTITPDEAGQVRSG
jgi:hypothetical protein